MRQAWIIGGSVVLLSAAAVVGGWCAQAPADPTASSTMTSPVLTADATTPAAAAYARGVTAYDAKRLDEAAQAWRQAIQLDPNFADAHVGLGVILLQRGDATGAEAEFQMAVGKNPNQVNALANLGALAVRRGQYVVAVSYYRRAIGGDPADASLWVDMATSYTGANDLPSARAAVLNALAFDPDSREAQELLARLERQMASAPPP